MEQYKTSDYNLAIFLLVEGLEFIQVEASPDSTERCYFVFNIPSGFVLSELLTKRHSGTVELFRKRGSSARFLKQELKKHHSLSEFKSKLGA